MMILSSDYPNHDYPDYTQNRHGGCKDHLPESPGGRMHSVIFGFYIKVKKYIGSAQSKYQYAKSMQ